MWFQISSPRGGKPHSGSARRMTAGQAHLESQGRNPRFRGRTKRFFAYIAVCAWVISGAAFGFAGPAAAATETAVSLTFDNNTISQYSLAYKQALQPHGAKATFYVNSRTVGASPAFMSWDQLAELAAAGNEIGGKTATGTMALSGGATQAKIDEVCDDRKALLQRGFPAGSFAYPFGAWDAAAQDIVKNCGYGNARAGGGIAPTGPFGGSIPPQDWYITAAYAPPRLTLADLKATVTGTATNGGWNQIVIQSVCSQTADPANYALCTSMWGWIELADLNAFLDWMQAAGQPDGAPAGAVLKTAAAVTGPVDTSTPATQILCNGAPCVDTAYTTAAYVTLPATDAGSGVASTHYTTDGSEPTLSSPTYSGQFPLVNSTTVRYRSWDYAGNTEASSSRTIQLALPPDSTPPTTTVTCNSSSCTDVPYAGPVTVRFDANDGSGWGVDKTYYTTDGSAPTTASTPYTGPFTLKQNATVKFFSVDLAGNANAVQSQAFQFQTIVTLTFDDSTLSQYALGFQRGLQPRGMRGTFYANTGELGTDGAMTWEQLADMANKGQEVGGHTLNHVNIKNLTDRQARIDQICLDRQNLLNHGLDPISFAYPEGAYDVDAKAIVQSCGYSTGRAAGGVGVNGVGAGPVYAESLPPADMFATRTVHDPSGGAMIQLADMQAGIVAATQNGGGWVNMNFHEICSQAFAPDRYDDCRIPYGSIELDTFNGLLDWLQNAGKPGGAPAGISMKTVRQAIFGPIGTISCNGAACSAGWYKNATQVALSTGDPTDKIYYTTDGSEPTTSSAVYTAPFSVAGTTTVKYLASDVLHRRDQIRSQLIQVDSVAPTASVSCNGAACGGWYNSAIQVSLAAVDNPGGSGAGKIYYTTNGSTPTTSSTVYTAPFSVASTATVKFFAVDAAGNVEAVKTQLLQVETARPGTAIACDGAACSTGWYKTSPVKVQLSATDTGGSGVDKTYYTTNGSTPTTSSTVYTAPFSVASTATVKYFSTDKAGNAEVVKSQALQIDAVAPSVAITQPATGSSFKRKDGVTLAAGATDAGTGPGAPSGIVRVEFYNGTTQLGSDTSNPYQYTWNNPGKGTYTIRAVAYDRAGNSKISDPITITVI